MGKKLQGAAAAGYQLALKLARDIAAEKHSGACHVEAQYHPGLPQRNLVAEYLERVRALQSPEAEESFAAMLTEFIASGVYGCLPSDPDKYYRQVVRERQQADVALSDQPFQRFMETAASKRSHTPP